MGCAVAYDLAHSRDVVEILLADLDRQRARAAADGFCGGKPEIAAADVRRPERLAKLLRGFDAVVNCTQYNWNLEVMQAALRARVHYLDLGGLFYTTRRQLRMHAAFREAKKTAILGMGSAPGLSNVMARFLADQLTRVDAIKVYNGSRDLGRNSDPLVLGFSVATILDELTIPPMAFVAGRFRQQPTLSGEEQVSFPEPIGSVTVRHSIHSEVATLPLSFRGQGVREVSFKINYDPELVSVVKSLGKVGLLDRMPVQLNGTKIAPRSMVEHLLRGRCAQNDSPARDIEVIRVIVTGTRAGEGRTLTLDATSRYSTRPPLSAVARDTGFPASIVAQMLARGDIHATGVTVPEVAIPPMALFAALERRSIHLSGDGHTGRRERLFRTANATH
jgi:saccharopine dehydrogenase-like NADP-dependent oxidoreductase